MNIDFQDKIDEFVLGRISDKDRIQLFKESSSNKEKQEQLELTKDLCKAIKSRNLKLSSISQFCKEYNAEQEHKSKKKKVMLWMSCAASIAAIFILGIFIFTTIENSFLLHTSQFAHVNHQIQPVDIKISQSYNKSLNDIIKLFNKTEYEEALKLIEISEEYLVAERNKLSVKSERPKEFNIDGFKVNDTNIFSNNKDSILNDELNYDSGKTNSKSLEAYEYALLWLKVNTLIGLNRIQEAKEILFDLRVIDGIYKSQVDSLLNEIENWYRE